MIKFFKAVAVSSLAALAVVAAVSATPAQAGWNGGWGGPAAVGLIGGLALGTILSQSHPAYADHYSSSGYSAYGGSCSYEERPVYRYGHLVGYRNVKVCY